MAADARVQELLLRWEELRERGQAPSAEELCRDCPELLQEVARRLRALQAVYRVMGTEAPAGATPEIEAGESAADRPAGARPGPPAPAGLPARAGRYVIEGEIARGGMGCVLRARDPDLNRALAVKVLLANPDGEPELARRFREEAQITGQLQHPGVPPVHEVGTLEDGRPFFAMKLIQGRTLDDLLKERSDPAEDLPRFLAVFEHVCQAVAYAHSRGVIHRDLKPLNVMVGAFGEVQVMDWGLAKVLGGGGPAGPAAGEASAIVTVRTGAAGLSSQAGAVLGTYAYMPPEQARGEVGLLDERCDVFGLGAILCVILTGRPPYTPAADWELPLHAAGGELGAAWSRLDGCGADGELVALAKACLAPAREARPRDAGAVAQAVANYQEGVRQRLRAAELERAAAQVKAAEERKRRRLAVALAGAVLVLVLAGVGGAWLLQQQRAEARTRQQQADQETRGVVERGLGLLDQGWQDHDLAKLKEAKAEGSRAVDIARSGGARAEVEQQAATFRAEAEERLGRSEKNGELLRALLDVSAPQETRAYHSDEAGRMVALAQPSVDEQYAGAFRRWGLDVDRTPEAEVVQRLRDEPGPVLQEVIAALDAWVLERRRQKRPEPECRRLLRLAEKLDRSDRRRQLRALLAGPAPPRAEGVAGVLGPWPPWAGLWELARGGNWRRLRELRGSMNPATEPVLSVVLLAQACSVVGDAAGAEDVLRQALAARPGQVVLLQTLGGLLERQGPSRLGEALECYRAARARDSRLGVGFGKTLVKAGRAGEGEAVLRDLVRQQPSNPEMHFYLGYALGEQKKPGEAVAAYREAIRLKPDFHKTHNNLGNALAAQGKQAEAVAAYREAIRLKPDLPEVHSNLGNALADQGKRGEAVAALREAIRLKPDLPGAHTNLGIALADQGKLVEAVAAHREALRLKPDYPKAHSNLGSALWAQGKRGEAVAAYREAIRLRPDYPGAHNNLGNALRAQGKLAEAVAAYREALRLKSDYAPAHDNLGVALQDQGKLPEAVAAHREAIRLKPKFPEAHNNLGAALAAQGKRGEAVAAYREAIRLKPDYHLAHSSLGAALAAQGKLAEAVAAFREAIRLKPKYANAYTNLGNALYAKGRFDEAIAAHRQAIFLDPKDAIAHTNLGGALHANGQLDEAIATYRKVILLDPKLPQARGALGEALLGQGNFAEAKTATRHCLDLLPPNHPLRKFVTQQLEQCERWLALDERLPAILQGNDKPADAKERIALAQLCQRHKHLYVPSARFYAEAFADQPRLAQDLRARHRYNAACAAALAAGGQGKEAAKPDEKEQARLRGMALDWLGTDLAAWTSLSEKATPQIRQAVRRTLRRWRQDPDLGGLRDKGELVRLPEAERQACRDLWAEVDTLLQRVGQAR